MWENIKNDEKDPSKRDPKRPSTWEKPAPKASGLTATAQSHPSGQITRPPNEGKSENKTDNRPRGPRGPKEFASGRNERGERICYTCGNTGHLASFHKKDDKGNPEPKKPGVHVVRTTGRKKGHERVAEKAWSLSDLSDSSENE
jgi:hypothetical protein